MRIKIKASNAAMHVENSTGAALVAAGLAEQLPNISPLPQPGQFTPPEPQWSVGIHRTSGGIKFLAVEMRIGQRHELFFGDPKFINARRANNITLLNGFGRLVPDATCREYEAAWRDNFSLRGPEVAKGTVANV